MTISTIPEEPVVVDYERCVSPEPTLSIPGTVCIEGNIGSGKSTLLEGLDQRGYWVAQEPVTERWGKHLPTLYSDQARWGFTFQIEVIDWYKELVQKIQKSNQYARHAVGGGQQVKIVERSPLSTYQIFGKNLRHQGNLTDWEMKLLGKVVESWAWTPEHTFYVDTPHEVAFQRLRQRDRDGEELVPKELLRQLELRHKSFIGSSFCGEVHILDGRLGPKELVQQAVDKLNDIQDRPSKARSSRLVNQSGSSSRLL